MYKYKINLVTMSDMTEFVEIVSKVEGIVRLTDGDGFCVNGKSILGAVATIEWNALYCVSDTDIYSRIEKYCV